MVRRCNKARSFPRASQNLCGDPKPEAPVGRPAWCGERRGEPLLEHQDAHQRTTAARVGECAKNQTRGRATDFPTSARKPANCRATHAPNEDPNFAARGLNRIRAPFDGKRGEGVNGDFWTVNFIARALRFLTRTETTLKSLLRTKHKKRVTPTFELRPTPVRAVGLQRMVRQHHSQTKSH
jgi:hypothetical protein